MMIKDSVDVILWKINNKIKLLNHVKPLNLEEEKQKVFSNFNYNPQFYYSNLSFNPGNLKQILLQLEIKALPISRVLQLKKEELIKEIELCEYIGKSKFTEKSIERYGQPKKQQVSSAKNDLENIVFEKEARTIGTEIIYKVIVRRLRQYGLNWKVEVKDSLADEASAGKTNIIFLRKNLLISKERLMTMIRHEIDCHALKAENGKYQPYKIFNYGFPNYLETEEGQAIYMVNKLGLKTKKIFFPQLRTILIDLALDHSFSFIFQRALEYGLEKEEAWNLCSRIKRGLKDTSLPGAFTKDGVYYPGYLKIKKYLNSNPINSLYLGKVSLELMEEIKKLPNLVKPRYLPLDFSQDVLDDLLN
ncbi:hypothetical protein A2160_00375 [Candidatus Beckwithbacteria bacterium RBG_13_42_9]|uniref:DUF1704 domain-containing protein n=1 Tax=Candidatus Beckwithbacteria bacterium RBG_13_42_9 TaxID=1797457 RepID=A0A1F5E542_9BACT|nr:MAG: hypothetical protein A2160_00375 [Candidatus Beckwithbacteria bacterium RBG_13_42_9]